MHTALHPSPKHVPAHNCMNHCMQTAGTQWQSPSLIQEGRKRASALDDAQSRFQRPARAGERAAPAVEFSFASSRSAAITSSSPFLAFMASSRRCRAPPVAVPQMRGFLAYSR